MEDQENSSTESTESTDEGAAGKAKAKRSSRSKNVEDKLDDLATRFSKAMTDGVKRMEQAFERGMENVKSNQNIGAQTTRVKSFFKSSTGGAILIVIGFVWFFYAVGLLDNPIFPIIVIVLGFYLMQRYKNQ